MGGLFLFVISYINGYLNKHFPIFSRPKNCQSHMVLSFFSDLSQKPSKEDPCHDKKLFPTVIAKKELNRYS